MEYNNEHKGKLIKYIRERESSFCDTKLEDFSVTQLIIAKSVIDASINYSKSIKKNHSNSLK